MFSLQKVLVYLRTYGAKYKEIFSSRNIITNQHSVKFNHNCTWLNYIMYRAEKCPHLSIEIFLFHIPIPQNWVLERNMWCKKNNFGCHIHTQLKERLEKHSGLPTEESNWDTLNSNPKEPEQHRSLLVPVGAVMTAKHISIYSEPGGKDFHCFLISLNNWSPKSR